MRIAHANLETYRVIETIANEWFDGHFTLLRFTTNWRLVFGTPTVSDLEQVPVALLPVGETLEEALVAALKEAGPHVRGGIKN